MTRGKAQRECDQRNQARQVTFHGFINANAAEFWANCNIFQNFIIHGGGEGLRSQTLVHMLRQFRSRCNIPVILLTGSAMTLSAVMTAAQNKELKKTIVFSPQYRSYHALYNMDKFQIQQLLIAIAEKAGCSELDRLRRYINAYIEISSRYFVPSLASLQKLDRQYPSNKQIQQLGRHAGVSEDTIMAINSYPEGTNKLRMVLECLSKSYENISTEGCSSQYNLVTCAQQGLLACISINTTHPRFLEAALAAELNQLISTNQQFLLILNDVPLMDSEGLYKEILRCKNVGSNTIVGICTQNVCAWASTVPQANDPEKSLVENTQNFVIFNNPNESDSNMKRILHYLGEFPKYDIQHGGGHEAVILPILTTENWNVVGPQNAARVTPAEAEGYGVILKGHDGRHIHLHHNMNL